ncbi:zinc finger protein CG2199 [Drosophila subobscura]|uniref:zinc finger protein CG2199 n=1 Tax=Drosophila subobscura TaxID=7241 RepID=UPI00155AFBA5|nr:zinc finger protein CG2199 [Drosophila subobscura]
MVNAKKEVNCDYCGSSNEPAQILTSKKAYFGNKVSDVLHAITQRNIPPTLAIKVCYICFSKFVQCERTIQKIQEFVDKGLSTSGGKKKGANNDEVKVEQSEEEVKNKKKPMKKRSLSVPGLGTLQPLAIFEAEQPKLSKGKTDSDILENSVVLKPAKTIDKKNNSVLSFFSPVTATAADSEEEEESEAEEKELPPNNVLIPDIFECRRCDFKVKQQKPMKQHYMQVHGQMRPRIYFCPMCTKSFGIAKTLTEHAKTVHGIEEQPKEKGAAGRAKTVDKEVPAVKKRRKSVVNVKVDNTPAAEDDDDDIEIIEEKSSVPAQTSLVKQQTSFSRPQTPAKQQTPSMPQTPVKSQKTPLKVQTPLKPLENEDHDESITGIRALNEHKKNKKSVANVDYTFAINGSSASTPKPNGEPIPSNSQLTCSICDAEQPSVKTMQRHMSTSHGIDKAKIFKCHKCEKSLASKQSLNYHLSWHAANPDAEVSSKRQITQADGPSSKRSKTKEAEDEFTDVADGAVSPPKKSKKLSETLNDVAVPSPKKSKKLSETLNDVAVPSPKKSKKLSETLNDVAVPSPKKSKKLSQTLNDVAVPSPKKSKKLSENLNDVAVSSPKKSQEEPIVSLLSDAEKWIFPRPKKTKERKESESVNISNGNSISASPSYPLSDMDVVNPSVQPHKREMLTSTCESTTADESEFNCSQCPKSVKSQRRLESHIAKMHGKSLKCSNCYNKYNTRQSYVVHFGECEGEAKESNLPCGVRKCKKVFGTVKSLEDHLKKRHQW